MPKYRLAFHFDTEVASCDTDMSAQEVISQQLPNKTFVVVERSNGERVYFRFGRVYMIEEQALEKEAKNAE